MLAFLIGLILFITIMAFTIAGAKGIVIPIAFIIVYWAVLKPLFSFSFDSEWRD